LRICDKILNVWGVKTVELRQIKSFLAVAETLNFGRAAERVHLSQPALSLQIRCLEDDIGVRLLDRNRRKTTLTPAGLRFQAEANQILIRVDHAVREAQLAAHGMLGSLRIGFISTAAKEIVPGLVREFRETHPDVDLSLRNILTMEQIRMLEADALDVGFLRLPVEGHPEIDLVPVHSEPFVLVVPSSHRLAMKKEIRLKETADERFVVYHRDDAPGFHDQIMGILRDANVVPTVSQTAGEMQTLVALVSANMGLSLLPASAMRGIPGVTACRIKDPIPLSAIAIASHKTNQQPAMVAFRKFALRALQAEKTAQDPMARAQRAPSTP
jgi:DNA-binding transcriptional LysR family regulator